jgi:hypothetical protein
MVQVMWEVSVKVDDLIKRSVGDYDSVMAPRRLSLMWRKAWKPQNTAKPYCPLVVNGNTFDGIPHTM